MNRSIKSMIAMAALAVGTLGAAAANASTTNVYLSVGVPFATQAVQAAPYPVPVHVSPRPVYDSAPAYPRFGRYRHVDGWQSACRAPGWDPEFRYMPGQTVWRKGSLWVATRLSASVWNVNSPPESTPSYWVPASCAA